MSANQPVTSPETELGPLSENCQATGWITTNVSLRVTGSSLDHGKWVAQPVNVNPPGGKAWEAWGAKGSATGAEGDVHYSAEDGATFDLHFDDPYSSSNEGSINQQANYTTSVNYPQHGSMITFNYGITKTT